MQLQVKLQGHRENEINFNAVRIIDTVEFYGLDLKHQDSNKILKQYANKLPQLKGYLFLKRFKRVDIEPEPSMPKVKVPKFQPLIRDQFNQCIGILPVNFKEIKIRKEPLTPIEVANLKLIDNDKQGSLNKCLNYVIITDITKQYGNNDRVLIECLHSKSKTPVDHAIMKGIEIVAQNECSKRTSHTGDILKRRSMDNDNISAVNSDSFEKGYLCKDLDVITVQESCAMCSMALVNSRIRKLFYINTHKSGCIESNYRMHQLSYLNHKFRSYKVDL